MLHGRLAITDLAHTPFQIIWEYMGQNTLLIFVSVFGLLWLYLRKAAEVDNFLRSPTALQSIKTDIRNMFRTHVFKINLKQCVGWDSAVDPMGACCINLIFRASTSRQVASLSSTSWKRRLEEEVTRCVGDAFIAPAGWSSLSRWVIHWASKGRRAVRAASCLLLIGW